ncbi:MAG: hypothetical protein ACQETB_09980 [Halobacteriota archaeon]
MTITADIVGLGVGAFAGLIAAIVLNWPMSRRSDGFTPAYVAAAVLRRRSPDEVPFRDAVIVHHLAGILAGVLYGLVAIGIEGSVVAIAIESGMVTMTATPSGGVRLLSHVFAVGLVVAFVYVLFAHLVLPRAGGRIYEEQSTAVRGLWLRSVLIYGAVVLVVVPVVGVSVG